MTQHVIRDVPAARTALKAFRVMSIVAGVALFVLIGEMVLKYGFENPVLSWWSPVHGLIFMVFAVATANLGFKVGWSLAKMAGILLASMIPVVPFVIEHKVWQGLAPELGLR